MPLRSEIETRCQFFLFIWSSLKRVVAWKLKFYSKTRFNSVAISLRAIFILVFFSCDDLFLSLKIRQMPRYMVT